MLARPSDQRTAEWTVAPKAALLDAKSVVKKVVESAARLDEESALRMDDRKADRKDPALAVRWAE
jgi:hypothetical protein